MTHYTLNNNERAGTGYTDLFILTQADDFTETTDDLDQVVTLQSLVAGDIVRTDIAVEVRTNVAGLTACNASIGITGNVDRFTANNNLLAAGDEFYCSGGDSDDHYIATAATALICNLDPGANTEALGTDATAGEIWIWANIQRYADRSALQVN